MSLYQSLLFVKEWVMSTYVLSSADQQATYESYCQSGTRICRFSTDGYGSSLSTLRHPRLSLLLLQLFVQVSGSCLLQKGRDPHLQYFLEIRNKFQDRACNYITCMACQDGKKGFHIAESERSIVIRIHSACVWEKETFGSPGKENSTWQNLRISQRAHVNSTIRMCLLYTSNYKFSSVLNCFCI